MKNVVRLALACAALALSATAHADTLNGTTVNGTLTGPTNAGYAPSSATVGSNVEFTSSAANTFSFNADFNDTGLSFTVGCNGTARACSAMGTDGFTATFTDTAFLDGTFSLVSGTNISYSLSGDVLTITGLRSSAGEGTTALDFTPAPTPEPSSLALLGTGILGVAGIARRRFSGK